MGNLLLSSLDGHRHAIPPDVHTSFHFFCSASLTQSLSFVWSGKPLQLTLQACDVKGKEEKSGPENLLVEPWTRDGEWWVCLCLVHEKGHNGVTRQLCETTPWSSVFRMCSCHFRFSHSWQWSLNHLCGFFISGLYSARCWSPVTKILERLQF